MYVAVYVTCTKTTEEQLGLKPNRTSHQTKAGFVLAVASTPSTGCDALFVQVLGGHPPVDRVHVAAFLCTCDVCALT